MKKFSYKAKDKNGKGVTGRVEASSEEIASKLIRDRGLILISLKPIRENPLSQITKVGRKISPNDVTTFTRQMATMVNAGLPLTEALSILRAQGKGLMQSLLVTVLAERKS